MWSSGSPSTWDATLRAFPPPRKKPTVRELIEEREATSPSLGRTSPDAAAGAKAAQPDRGSRPPTVPDGRGGSRLDSYRARRFVATPAEESRRDLIRTLTRTLTPTLTLTLTFTLTQAGPGLGSPRHGSLRPRLDDPWGPAPCAEG